MGVLILPYIRSRMPCLRSGKLFLPLRGKLFSRVVAYLANLGKPIAPFIGTSGLDDHS